MSIGQKSRMRSIGDLLRVVSVELWSSQLDLARKVMRTIMNNELVIFMGWLISC